MPCYGRSVCLGAEVFKAKYRRGFFGVVTLGVHKRMLVSKCVSRCSSMLWKLVHVSLLEDYFLLQVLQKLLEIS